MNRLPEFDTLHPASLAEAVNALAAEGARPLGGGTDLLPNLRRGLGRPRALVDLAGVAGLAGISVMPDGGLRIGAATPLQALAEHAGVRAGWPTLAEAAALVAGPTHRAAATLGGNLCQDTRCVFYNQSAWWRAGNDHCLKYEGTQCHVVVKNDRCYATYHGDVAPALMVLDAQVEITGPAGRRSGPVGQLFREHGAEHLALAPGELVTAVTVAPATGWRSRYLKLRVREAIDFPLAGVAAALRREGDQIAGLRLAITGTNSAPLMVPTESLVGGPWDAASAARLVQAVRDTANVLLTTVATVKYRRRVLLGSSRHLVDVLWAGA